MQRVGDEAELRHEVGCERVDCGELEEGSGRGGGDQGGEGEKEGDGVVHGGFGEGEGEVPEERGL